MVGGVLFRGNLMQQRQERTTSIKLNVHHKRRSQRQRQDVRPMHTGIACVCWGRQYESKYKQALSSAIQKLWAPDNCQTSRKLAYR